MFAVSHSAQTVLFEISEVMYHNYVSSSPPNRGELCGLVLLEQRNSLLWELLYES